MSSPTRHLIVVDRMSDWQWQIPGITPVPAKEFLTRRPSPSLRPLRVLNLCRRYQYLSGGYYCSLLAEARGDLPMPTVADILDLSRKSLYAFALPELEKILRDTLKRLGEPPQTPFDLNIFFGHADDARFQRLASEAFDIFRYPLLRLKLIPGKERWKIKAIEPLGLHKLKGAQAEFFEQALRLHLRMPKRRKIDPLPPLFDLAILWDANEKLSPSNEGAIHRFIKAGAALRIDVALIGARDYHRIAEFDALFLRETTALNHHTFRFARKAEAEGIPVIDDCKSMLRCTNKVYMWERLNRMRLPTPRTIVLDRVTFDAAEVRRIEEQLGYPMVLKIPDGSFSRGMFKADNRARMHEAAAALFAHSRLILAQEFMYTAFDWRIGILNGKPLYACQYRVSRGHWQIVKHRDDGSMDAGGFETLPIESVPPEVLTTAMRAASTIGDGLYGVDLKQNEQGVFVIEINDNPNIDKGIEDKVLKYELYSEIMRDFIRRIEATRG